jgi:hypothetical protein
LKGLDNGYLSKKALEDSSLLPEGIKDWIMSDDS